MFRITRWELTDSVQPEPQPPINQEYPTLQDAQRDLELEQLLTILTPNLRIEVHGDKRGHTIYSLDSEQEVKQAVKCVRMS